MTDCMEIELSPSKLRKQRIKCGLTQAAVAAMVGVSMRSYFMWEKGETTPSATSFLRLLYVFGLMNEPGALTDGHIEEGDADA